MNSLTHFLGSVTGFLDKWETLLDRPINIVHELTDTIPGRATYFINYIMTNTFLAYALFLLRPAALILRFFKLKFLAKTASEIEEVNALEHGRIGPWTARLVLIFIIVQSYAILAPFLLIFACMYFAMALITSQYNFIYVFKQVTISPTNYFFCKKLLANAAIISFLPLKNFQYIMKVFIKI